MSENSFKFPHEVVELPSKGLLYPKDSLLASGKVSLRYPTAREEDILSNMNFIRQGIVIDKLLQSLIVDKVKYDDLLIGDKNAIMIAARILMYGKEYKFTVSRPDQETPIPITVDLTQVKEKFIDEKLVATPGVNEFSFELPNTQTVILFKLPSQGDENKIEQEIKALKKINPNSSTTITTRLKHLITSIGGNRETKFIREFIDNELISRDSKALRSYMLEITPNVDLKYQYDFGDGLVEESMPITVEFFWPE